MSEAFVYLWFDSKNRKFYLGKHKGTPDDGYTHSSTVMESFDVPPPHMKRRILAYGTDEEMCLLEHELLKNRKGKKWDRYYNQSLGSPWLDQWGENNPSYKHGMTGDPEWNKKIKKDYYEKNKEKFSEKSKKYYEENKEKLRERHNQWWENNKEIQNERRRKLYKENREKILERNNKWIEKNKDKRREYERRYRAENKDKQREYERRYRAKKKAEKLAQQTGATLPL